MYTSWLSNIKDGVVAKASDAAAAVALAAQAQLEDAQENEASEYYDSEEEDDVNSQDDTEVPVRKQAIEMRLIIKQACITPCEQDNPFQDESKVKVVFSR